MPGKLHPAFQLRINIRAHVFEIIQVIIRQVGIVPEELFVLNVRPFRGINEVKCMQVVHQDCLDLKRRLDPFGGRKILDLWLYLFFGGKRVTYARIDRFILVYMD